MTNKEKAAALERLTGIPVILDDSIPFGEIHIKSGDVLLKTITVPIPEARKYDAEWPEILYEDVLDADLIDA